MKTVAGLIAAAAAALVLWQVADGEPAAAAKAPTAAATTAVAQTAAAAPSAVRAAEAATRTAEADADAPVARADEAPLRLAQALFQEGVHYQRLTPVQPTSSPAGTVEVTEFFMYSCPHCFSFEPHLETWLESKPSNVNFVRIPASFNSLAALHAKAFYAAEMLGVLDDVHDEFFREFHVRKNRLNSEKAIVGFFVEQGVDKAAFEEAMASFPVDAKLKKGNVLAQRYGLTSVPSVYVNGKYRTDAAMAGGYPALLRVIDYLVAIESASEEASAAAGETPDTGVRTASNRG